MNSKAIVFDKLPVHDTCWSLTTGIDGIIYIGVCCEMTGGISAYIASYDPDTEKVKYLVDVADAVGVPPDNGQSTHGKIHYCLLPGEDGIIYAATHSTAPPIGDFVWRPWNTWSHPQKVFSGSKILGYDPKKDEILFIDSLLPKEGSRCMGLDQKRRRIYGISYPRDHFFIYDIDKHSCKDLGRIGSVNPMVIFFDKAGNAYTTSDCGVMVRYNINKEELEELDIRIPHAPFRSGFHSVLYDAVGSPDGQNIYGVTWDYNVRLFKYCPEEGPQGRIYDLGRAGGEETTEWWDIKDYHMAGLVFGLDKNLYFAMNFHNRTPSGPYIIRYNPENGEKKELCLIKDRDIKFDHISRATRDFYGNLYFADVGMIPTKLFFYKPDYGKLKVNREEPKIIRSWG